MGNVMATHCFAQQKQEINFDSFGRLTNYPDKIETHCPSQNKKMAVLIVIGQSNAANHGQEKFSTTYPTKVFNYFN